jgi:Flp pilus assembly protein TadG
MLFRRVERGQATVEFAFLLPLVALVLAGLFEVAMLMSDHARVQYAAREATRTAAVDPDPENIEEAARRSRLEGLEVTVSPKEQLRVQGEPVTVRISYEPVGRLPMVGYLAERVTLTSVARMRIERP